MTACPPTSDDRSILLLAPAVDAAYGDERLAAVYDALNPWGRPTTSIWITLGTRSFAGQQQEYERGCGSTDDRYG
jgi:hypothetical protein